MASGMVSPTLDVNISLWLPGPPIDQPSPQTVPLVTWIHC